MIESRRAATSSRKRILFVVNHAGFFVSHRLPLAVAALKQGYEVHVAVPATEPETSIIADTGAQLHDIPLHRSSMLFGTEARTLRALIALYKKVQPDLVHHVTVKPIIYGSIAARIAKVPAVVNAVSGLGYLFLAQGWRASLRRRAVEWAYRTAFRNRRQRTIFQNPDDTEAFLAARIISADQAVLIPGSGVDLDAFVPRPEPEGVPVVMLPSRLLWDKGVGEFVAAAEQLKAEGIRARFVLVGDVDHNRTSVTSSELQKWSAGNVVEWWNYQTDMPATLAKASIVCLPSYREGLPKVLLEAAACGRPIVTTDVPGCREAVRHNDNGLLVPPRDSQALARALRTMLEDDVNRRRMGKQGRIRAEQEFGIDRVIAANLSLYNQLLN